MASKNHHRYRLRKHMNTIKHKPKQLFDEPPVLISTWEELNGLETDKYRIEVDLRWGNGHVRRKIEVPEDDSYFFRYLSTHTFYGSQYFYSTVELRKLGFNVQLANWDGETTYCKY